MIAIIDYNMGNFASVQNMIKKNGGESIVTDHPDRILKATKLILPGVGHFARGMENLRSKRLIEVLNYKVLEEKTPILGICLGMQLLTNHSEEGDAEGLKWIDARIVKFNFSNMTEQYKIPNMGWHHVMPKKQHALFNGYHEVPKFYFVHSFYCKCTSSENELATAHYGLEYCCAVEKENVYGTQFHPEKSHKYGMQLIHNFLKIGS